MRDSLFIHNFSALFQEKYFLSFVIPPFHHDGGITLSVSVLYEVELVVEYGWNYRKFHPYSTHNSTLDKPLSIREVTIQGWKSGITNEKIYFSEIRVGKVLTTVKNNTKYGYHFIGKHFLELLVVGYDLLVMGCRLSVVG